MSSKEREPLPRACSRAATRCSPPGDFILKKQKPDKSPPRFDGGVLPRKVPEEKGRKWRNKKSNGEKCVLGCCKTRAFNAFLAESGLQKGLVFFFNFCNRMRTDLSFNLHFLNRKRTDSGVFLRLWSIFVIESEVTPELFVFKFS